jgi:four helix bundle protein
MAFAFEKLLVYQESVDFAEAVCAATRRFPRGYYFLADQLNRAALSIAANLAEGNGRFTIPDRRNFFGIARGSVRECVPLLEVAMRRQVLEAGVYTRLRGELEEISRMLSGLIKGLDRRRNGGSGPVDPIKPTPTHADQAAGLVGGDGATAPSGPRS